MVTHDLLKEFDYLRLKVKCFFLTAGFTELWCFPETTKGKLRTYTTTMVQCNPSNLGSIYTEHGMSSQIYLFLFPLRLYKGFPSKPNSVCGSMEGQVKRFCFMIWGLANITCVSEFMSENWKRLYAPIKPVK